MNELDRSFRPAREADVSQAAGRAARLAASAADRAGLLEVAIASYASPLGSLLLAATSDGLVRVAYPEEDRDRVLEDLAGLISPRIMEHPGRLEAAMEQLEEYFSGRRSAFDLPIDWSVVGGFRRRVLEVTARIPFGEVATYGSVAAEAGNPRAARAAGGALAANPVPIVVPCHRVVRSGGALGGYAGGISRKERLLRLEGALTA